MPAAQSEAAEPEEQNPEEGATDDLHEGGEGDRFSRRDDLLQIDLEPDHEEKKDQPQLRDRRDAFAGFDEAQADRAERESSEEISEQDRLPEMLGHEPEQPGGGDAESDVADQFVHEGSEAWPSFGLWFGTAATSNANSLDPDKAIERIRRRVR